MKQMSITEVKDNLMIQKRSKKMINAPCFVEV